ncbi:hypothetical protein F53441_10275 [Fusarium austroafricanum]|uniref:Uncharacterized protein n=1 Tax=Fusarium austroafricanum TaxID=2364996 RepID=A0A8H4K9V8_9HYPO|nr:hypothetical protein F53441_10275 [Fusarium austroafricanum]
MFGPLDLGFTGSSKRNMVSVVFSPYSPLALRDIPQPKPNDAPSDIDTSIFTFEDAFEDLLAVSQGQQLPDIRSRYEQRKLLRSMFPTGEPGYFWMRRLRSQGLLEEFEPVKLIKSLANSNWEQFHEELDRRAQEVWRAALGGEDDEDGTLEESRREHALSSHPRNDESTCLKKDNQTRNDIEDLRDGLHRHRNLQREANNFDDLFSAIQSSFADSQSPWDSFMKLITEDHPAPLNREQKRLQKSTSDEKQLVTKDEYVDQFGYLHTKTLVKTLDADGNEIGSHSHYTVRPAQKENESAQTEEKGRENQDSGLKVDGSIETKTGWFWK